MRFTYFCRSTLTSGSVYRATNYETSEVAACKVISITSEMTSAERKVLSKEMHVHSIMKHPNVLEFYKAIIVEENNTQGYYPAYYFLLELAAGGDLFDKIGKGLICLPRGSQTHKNVGL